MPASLSREERGPTRQWQSPWTAQRSAEEVRASIYSLSSAAPHLFAFDTLLRDLLNNTAADGMFNERLRRITADIWR